MNNEITTYVEGVRRALAGLAETTREELLEDLPEHLAEVQAEGTGTLVERLGTPEAYAKELIATAGLTTAGFPSPPPDPRAQLLEAREQALQVLRRADVKIGPVIGYEKASDFLVLLRPAWWVLRGYLLAMALAYMIAGSSSIGLLPRIGDNELVALVLLGGCVIVSIMVGRRTLAFWPRYALWAGTAVLVVFAMSAFFVVDSSARNPGYSEMGNYDANPYSNVNDVFVYDSQGRLVTDARLYDQDGNPIQLGNNWCTDPNSGESDRSRAMGLPHCPANAPFGVIPNPSASAQPPASGAPPSASPVSGAPSPASPTSGPPSSGSAPPSPAASGASAPTASPSR